MKVQQNIGIVNALIRITLGFTLLAWATAKLVKKPWRESYIMIGLMAAMKIGEGILRYCPLTDLYEKSQSEDRGQGANNDQGENSSQGSSRQDEGRKRQHS